MKQFVYLNCEAGVLACQNYLRGRVYELSEQLLVDVFRVAQYDLAHSELTEIVIHYPNVGDTISSGAELLCSWREFGTVSEWLAYNQLTNPAWIKWAVPIMQVLYAMNTAFPEIRSFSYTVDEEAGLFFKFSKENIY